MENKKTSTAQCVIALILSLLAIIAPLISLTNRYFDGVRIIGYGIFFYVSDLYWEGILIWISTFFILLSAVATVIIAYLCFSPNISKTLKKAITPCVIIMYAFLFLNSIFQSIIFDGKTLAYIPWAIGSLILAGYFLAPRLLSQKELYQNTGSDISDLEKYERIKEYKKLLDNGIITQAEFDKTKAKILGL